MMENWKNYDATHKVSDHGRVMWFDGKDWRPKKTRTDKQGELEISFKGYKLYVKRLVAALFVENPENYPCVFCKDGDKTNCRADNLEWGSRSGRKHKGLDSDAIISRIIERHGDRYLMLGDYEKACNPVRFRCTKCGKDFYQTPHLVSIGVEPCPHCREEQRKTIEAKNERITPENFDYIHRHVVYAYIFDDGHAYVGLTCNQRQRDHSHRCDDNSAVYLHSKETGAAIPTMTILEQGLNAREAQRYERLWLKWMSKTFTMLNRVPAGGLGGIFGNVPHTIENARKVKERFRTRKALRWHCRWAWEMLRENGELPKVNDWQRYIHKKKHKNNHRQVIIPF